MLIVDDEAAIRDILREFLSRAGHEATTAANGETSLQLLANRRFDVLITDLNMPGVSGWDLARHAREQFPELFIILLTGDREQIDLLNRENPVADIILNKPIDISLLSQIVTRAERKK